MRKGSSGSIELYALQIQCISFRYRSKELNVISLAGLCVGAIFHGLPRVFTLRSNK